MTVPFFDVDSMNIVWHGHYAKYLELARCQLLDEIGYNYEAMAASGYGFPIIDMQIKYVQALRFNQDVCVTATLEEWQQRLLIRYRIVDARSGECLTKAHTTQAAVSLASGVMQFECPEMLRRNVETQLAAQVDTP